MIRGPSGARAAPALGAVAGRDRRAARRRGGGRRDPVDHARRQTATTTRVLARKTTVLPDDVATATVTRRRPTAPPSRSARRRSRSPTITAWDPDGSNGSENDAQAPLALADGSGATSWSTECYSSQYMGGKSGVGLIVTLVGRVGRATSTWSRSTPRTRCRCSRRPTPRRRPTLAGWGEPIDDKAFADDPGRRRDDGVDTGEPPACLAHRARSRQRLQLGQPLPRAAGRDHVHGLTAMPADDAELVASAQAGDRVALDRLLRLHYDRVHAVCRRIVGTSHDADDAAQEAMIRIVKGLRSLRRPIVVRHLGLPRSPATPPSTSSASDAGGRCCTSSATTARSPEAADQPRRTPRRGDRRAAVARRRDRRPARRLPGRGRAPRRRRPRLQRDRRGARCADRHRQVEDRPWPVAARRPTREPRHPRRTSNTGHQTHNQRPDA